MKARWVLKWFKDSQGKPKAKARLVIRGYNDPDALNGNLNTASPTTTRLAKLCLLSITAMLKWKLWTADVATAFLQGTYMAEDRVIFVQLPADAAKLLGMDSQTVMKLKKPMYGQGDAPLNWYLEANSRLKYCGLRNHPLDPCLYLLYDRDELVLMIRLHVDDMLGAVNAQSKKASECVANIKKAFNFRTWQEEDEMEYCGSTILRESNGDIKMKFDKYAKKLSPVTVPRDHQGTLNAKQTTALRALLGALQWPSSQGVPHLQCSVSMLCGRVRDATEEEINETNKALRFFKTNADVGLTFPADLCTDIKDTMLVTMTEAAWGTRKDNSSQGGYLIFLCSSKVMQGQVGSYALLDWNSFKLGRVCRSSLSAEAQACSAGVDAI